MRSSFLCLNTNDSYSAYLPDLFASLVYTAYVHCYEYDLCWSDCIIISRKKTSLSNLRICAIIMETRLFSTSTSTRLSQKCIHPSLCVCVCMKGTLLSIAVLRIYNFSILFFQYFEWRYDAIKILV